MPPQPVADIESPPIPLTGDMVALRAYWHPVCYSHDLDDAPLGVKMLGEAVVVYRTGEGVHAFRDLCPHRGAKISMGPVVDGELTCPYHGFRYDTTGRCVAIPGAVSPDVAIPSRLRLERYQATERYGIVWVALEEPKLPIPEFPQYDDPAYRSYFPGAVTWRTSAARFLENFLDVMHLPHVHPGILGDPDESQIAPYDVEMTATGLRFEVPLRQQLDPLRWARKPGGALDLNDALGRYDLFLPFTLSLATDEEEGTWQIWSAALPVHPTETKIFFVLSRTYLHETPDEEFSGPLLTIVGQDQRIAEQQHPERLPIDLTEEVHLRVGDAASIAYRSRLREMGLERP